MCHVPLNGTKNKEEQSLCMFDYKTLAPISLRSKDLVKSDFKKKFAVLFVIFCFCAVCVMLFSFMCQIYLCNNIQINIINNNSGV